MYSEKLEKLIEFAMIDGTLPEKKKQVLFKSAEAEGVDLDEFEMVIEGRLFEKQQTSSANKQIVETTSVEQVPKNQSEISFIQRLFKLIAEDEEKMREELQQELEKRRKERNSFNIKNTGKLAKDLIGSSIPGLGLAKEIFGSDDNDSDEKYEDLELEDKINATTIERKKRIINTFPIPELKKDVLEFLSFSIPNSRKKKGDDSHNAVIKEWMQKSELIITKSRISFKDDDEVMFELNKYEIELQEIQKSQKKGFLGSLFN